MRPTSSGVPSWPITYDDHSVCETGDGPPLPVGTERALDLGLRVRARRFYERCGWHDSGPFDEPAWTPDGTTIRVPSRRYEKAVGPR